MGPRSEDLRRNGGVGTARQLSHPLAPTLEVLLRMQYTATGCVASSERPGVTSTRKMRRAARPQLDSAFSSRCTAEEPHQGCRRKPYLSFSSESPHRVAGTPVRHGPTGPPSQRCCSDSCRGSVGTPCAGTNLGCRRHACGPLRLRARRCGQSAASCQHFSHVPGSSSATCEVVGTPSPYQDRRAGAAKRGHRGSYSEGRRRRGGRHVPASE